MTSQLCTAPTNQHPGNFTILPKEPLLLRGPVRHNISSMGTCQNLYSVFGTEYSKYQSISGEILSHLDINIVSVA